MTPKIIIIFFLDILYFSSKGGLLQIASIFDSGNLLSNMRVYMNKNCGPHLAEPVRGRSRATEYVKLVIHCFSLLYICIQCDAVFMTL